MDSNEFDAFAKGTNVVDENVNDNNNNVVIFSEINGKPKNNTNSTTKTTNSTTSNTVILIFLLLNYKQYNFFLFGYLKNIDWVAAGYINPTKN